MPEPLAACEFWKDRGQSLVPTPVQPTYVPLARVFALPTEGRHPAVDALAVIQELLSELPVFQRRGIVAFLQETVHS